MQEADRDLRQEENQSEAKLEYVILRLGWPGMDTRVSFIPFVFIENVLNNETYLRLNVLHAVLYTNNH